MHHAVSEWVRQHAPSEPVAVIEYGSRDLNGTVRGLFHPDCAWVGIDLYDGPCVDWVGDANDYQPEAPADVVVCCEVFEHDPLWPDLLVTAARHLRPGGRIIATAAGPGRAPHSGIEATGLVPGEFYRNVPADELATALDAAGFVDVLVDVDGYDVRCVATLR